MHLLMHNQESLQLHYQDIEKPSTRSNYVFDLNATKANAPYLEERHILKLKWFWQLHDTSENAESPV